MADFPSMPFWTDAYLGDCGHLSDEEHGRYLLLLLAMWRAPNRKLPNDDAWLARKFSRPIERVRTELRPLIAEFCKTDGNWIWQKRVLREWRFVEKQRRAQSERAKRMWEKKKSASRADAASGNAPTPTPTPPIREEVDTSTEFNIERTEKLSLFVEHTKTPPAVLANGHSHHAFAEWWQRYPRKVGKLACATKYAGIVRRREATAEQLAAGLERYIATKPSTQDWCHPLTWLNQGRWTDEGQKTQSDIAQDWFNAQQRGSA